MEEHESQEVNDGHSNGMTRRAFGVGAAAWCAVAVSGFPNEGQAGPAPVCYKNVVFDEKTGTAFPAFGLWLVLSTNAFGTPGKSGLIYGNGSPVPNIAKQLADALGLCVDDVNVVLNMLKDSSYQTKIKQVNDIFQHLVAVFNSESKSRSNPVYQGSHCPGTLNSILPVLKAVSGAKPGP